MKAGEHLKVPSGMYNHTWKNYHPSREKVYKEPSSDIFTVDEHRFIQQLDPWKMKVIVKHCPLCGGKYIPTIQSNKRCIPCNYEC